MAYERLKNLGDDRYHKIQIDLLGGVSPGQVSKLIREDWKEFLDVSDNTLIQQLKRFRTYLGEEKKQNPPAAIEKETELPLNNTDLDCKKELEGLILLLRGRLQFLLEKEKVSAMSSPSLNKAILDCGICLKDAVRDLENSEKAETNEIWLQLFDPI